MAVAVTPRSVVLNLLRVTSAEALPISRLVAIGGLFGFTGNALRVAVARLLADGLLESDERGSYRLGSVAAPLQAHVEEWRKGEARTRPWKGGWLAVALTSKVDRGVRRGSLRALERMGLHEGLPGLWVRPDNLAQPIPRIIERLRELGLEDAAEPFRARDFGEDLEQRLRGLWPTRALQKGYERALGDLRRSLQQLDAMPRESALVQSFLHGGEAIRVLATDPLLPDAILASDTRRELTELMLRYDAVGRRLWSGFGVRPELTVLQGGNGGKGGRGAG